jgi:hypothetical protein
MSFDFGAALHGDRAVESFHPAQQTVLPKGNYVVKITEIEQKQSSSGNWMIALKMENEEGIAYDNLVLAPNEFSMRKLAGFVESIGLSRPVAGTDIKADSGQLSGDYVAKFMAKTIGIIVRDEEDNRPDHVGEMRPRVQGYADPAEIKVTKAADAPAATTAKKANNDNIPF